MQDRVADNFIHVMTGSCPTALHDAGVLEREWCFLRELLRHYERLVIATPGDARDEDALRARIEPELAHRVTVVCNRSDLCEAEWARVLPEEVAAAAPGRTAVLRTNELLAGESAVSIASAVRGAGLRLGAVARGGYLWTRFVAHEAGPHSPEALRAAASEKSVCRFADVVVGTTQAMVDDLAWRYGLDPARTVVIPNFVLPSREDALPPREPDLLLCVGDLAPRKRVHLIIEAAALLKESGQTVRLEVVGDGAERGKLEELARSRSAPVEFTGRLPYSEVLRRMSRCSLFLQASEIEGQPKAVLEAMSCGAVVVVADTPGLAATVHHGVTGLRCASDPEAFRHVISEVMADADWRDVLGSAAARMTQATYGLPTVLRQELEVHRRALRHGALRGGETPALRASA